MTARVGSRYYRAPELIVCQNNYEHGVDIWSIGCILGELLLNFVEQDNSSKDSIKCHNDMSKYFLFPGDSCYPISPLSKKQEENQNSSFLSDNDQIIKIFELLGMPTRQDFSFVD